ncbi:MAG: hypothetical protein R2877_07090 [Bdellovibrionota bacterium]
MIPTKKSLVLQTNKLSRFYPPTIRQHSIQLKAAIVNQLTAGLPAQTRMSTNVNAAHAVYQIITAANLGITPRIGLLGFGTGDWY